MKYLKKFTYKEWKAFGKQEPKRVTVQMNLQFWNHLTQKYERQTFITAQEMLLHRYVIIITDHINRRKVGKMCPTPFKELFKGGVKSIPSKITQENFDKGMTKFNSGMDTFNKAVQTFSSGLGDGKGSQKKDKENLNTLVGDLKSRNTEKIWGLSGPGSKSNTPLWSSKQTPKRKPRRKRKPKSNSNMDRIWGKKRRL